MLFVCISPILTNLCPLFPSWNGIVPNINRALKSANLGSNNIGDEGAIAISTALKNNNTLTEIDLNGLHCAVTIGNAGAQAIAKMLAVNRALTSVNLLKNNLGDGATAVVAAAKQHGKIKTLCGTKEGQTAVNLRDKYLTAPDVVLLSFDLESNRALTWVNCRPRAISFLQLSRRRVPAVHDQAPRAYRLELQHELPSAPSCSRWTSN